MPKFKGSDSGIIDADDFDDEARIRVRSMQERFRGRRQRRRIQQ
jgi:hypothetical protein